MCDILIFSTMEERSSYSFVNLLIRITNCRDSYRDSFSVWRPKTSSSKLSNVWTSSFRLSSWSHGNDGSSTHNFAASHYWRIPWAYSTHENPRSLTESWCGAPMQFLGQLVPEFSYRWAIILHLSPMTPSHIKHGTVVPSAPASSPWIIPSESNCHFLGWLRFSYQAYLPSKLTAEEGERCGC